MGQEKKYPLRGGEITAKEAADHFHISIHSVRNRLNKTGNDMEAVFAYYEDRYGGVTRACAR